METEIIGEYENECISIYSYEAIMNESDLQAYLACLSLQDSIDKMLRQIRVLNSSPQSQLDKFCDNNKGLAYFSFCLKTAISQIGGFAEEELIECILDILERIRLTRFHLDITQLPHLLNELKNKAGIPESFTQKIYNFVLKWKPLVSDWSSRNQKWKDFDYTKFFREKEYEYTSSLKLSEEPKSYSNHREHGKSSKRRRSRSVLPKFNLSTQDPILGLQGRNITERNQNLKSAEEPYGMLILCLNTPVQDLMEIIITLINGGLYLGFELTVSSWASDHKITKVRYFTRTEKPSAPGLTIEEVEKIQKKIVQEQNNSQNPFFEDAKGEELKHKESLMEGNSLKKVTSKFSNKETAIRTRNQS